MLTIMPLHLKSSDENYILVGCDGGLYESFDKTKNWKFIDNLPSLNFIKLRLMIINLFIMFMVVLKIIIHKELHQELIIYMELEILIGLLF